MTTLERESISATFRSGPSRWRSTAGPPRWRYNVSPLTIGGLGSEVGDKVGSIS